MYAPAPPRNKKTDITRSRSGCVRCRQKRRKCDEGKPSCRRCVTAMANCEYGAITLKFREATRWAAQKVELGKGMPSAAITRTTLPPPQNSAEIVQGHRGPISDESTVSPVYQQVSPPQDTEAPLATYYHDAPPAPFLVEQNDCCQSSAGVPELGVEVDPSPISVTALDPPIGSQGSVPGSLLHSCYSPKWSGAHLSQLGFDLASTAADADDALYPNLLDFPENLVDTGLSEPYWSEIMMQNPVGNSPASSLQQSTDTDAQGNCDIVPTCQPLVLDHPQQLSDQQQSSPSAEWNYQTSKANTSHGNRLISVQLPWPKAQKPPPGSKISVGHRIYLAHFKVAILQAFPLELPFLWDMVIKSEPVRYAALSLSAANLANLQGQQPDDNEPAWVAMPVHSARASAFSTHTVEALENGTAVPLDARIVTMILVVFYELEASSFSSASHSLSILNVMILSCPEDVLSSANGRIIIQWWLHLRTFIANAQGPYSLYGAEDPAESLINQLEVRVAGAPQMIDLITTKATRIWHRVLVAKCFEVPEDRPVDTMRKVDDWWRILKGNHLCDPARDDESLILGEDELYEELENLQRTLDACDAPSDFRPSMLEEGPASREILPLRFPNHRRAIEVADFAFAHILCAQERLRAMVEHSTDLPRQFPDTALDPAITMDAWVYLLLRTVAGLDVSKCARENTYRRGIISSLFYTGLFYPGQVSSKFITDAIKRMIEARMEFENPFYPLRAFIDFQNSLQHQVAGGRTIFFVCSTYDEWTTRETVLSGWEEEYLMVLGCEPDGRYFNDLVPFTQT
ncbi:uncharacterized protein NECHADRAFT_86310 [Fusarium vanettenii 77-13-4]|uniref:Zn(2)-C6 fungal-type domain-containing protein n=1 Tax=Fusarium vanettenii (strain ATCC MYA-4622 / CBS 123669 / FGSC 9596 / NRRL 45880 / 77-13-4) TaxID=660122 RepID=C7ZEQ7_FUSV7|nr:uncharacterized protein NECHADRAFT_86310 [Fusarium vanettenii 77-13-4]EEU37462.1 predicted protein [Fusarium vanettenii 77-13-4]